MLYVCRLHVNHTQNNNRAWGRSITQVSPLSINVHIPVSLDKNTTNRFGNSFFTITISIFNWTIAAN